MQIVVERQRRMLIKSFEDFLLNGQDYFAHQHGLPLLLCETIGGTKIGFEI